jgi:adenylylsulfate kinase-like enzyme
LYKKAMNGEIPHFTGVSAPYEPPEHPDLIVHSDKEDAVTAADRVLELIKARQVLS